MKARKKTKVENAVSRYWSQFAISYNTFSDFEKELVRKTSKQYYEDIFKEIELRASQKRDETAFYELKNSSYEGSIALSMFFYGDLYTKISKYLLKKREILSGSIIDVGCDNGLFTCFVAKICPDSKVIGIDICPSAIENAKRLADNLHLSNVEFINKSLAEVEDKFDIIVSLCTAHENLIIFELNRFEPIAANGDKYKESIDPFFKQICNIAKEDAVFFNIDKNNIDAQQLGYMLSMDGNGMDICDIKRLYSYEGVDRSAFSLTVGAFDSEIEEQNDDELSTFELFNMFLAKEEGIKGNEPQYDGLLAQVYYQNSVRDTILAYQFFAGEMQIGMVGLFTDDDPTSVIVYDVVWNDEEEDLLYHLYNYDVSEKENLEAEIKRAKEAYEKNGFTVKQYWFPKEQILPEDERMFVLRIREVLPEE